MDSFLAAFRAHADAEGRMRYVKFMELALYDPDVGYYRRPELRVGTAPGTDYFTASTGGRIFGELVAAACTTLLRATGRDPATHTFIEVGVEPGREGVLSGLTHPFEDARSVRVADALTLEGECVVFSNELFDAQPFVRSVFRHGRWVEIGVELRGDTLLEVEMEAAPPFIPGSSIEGYHFDQPLAAVTLAETIAAQPWRGLFVAIDYGKTTRELLEETPGGTARSYYRHTQSNDLLARPGEQDLTCHICWDWLIDALQRHGFAAPVLSFQETFFMRQAADFIAGVVQAEAARFSTRKQALAQLLHPSHLGQKFQILHALR